VLWPYSINVYINRFIWLIIRLTVWRLCWKRIYILRGLLLRFFGAKGSLKVQIAGSVRIEIPMMLYIGKHVTIGDRAYLYNLGGLIIGDHSVISQDAYLCGGTHDYSDLCYPLIRKKITVGRGVWIAAGAFIGPGVTIGDGAIIGARSVVIKDVEPWTVVAGNPARVIKRRVMKPEYMSSEIFKEKQIGVDWQ